MCARSDFTSRVERRAKKATFVARSYVTQATGWEAFNTKKARAGSRPRCVPRYATISPKRGDETDVVRLDINVDSWYSVACMMLDVHEINVPRRWEECPREAREARWASLFATLSARGDLAISRFTHEALGSPDSYVLLYDRDRHVIGMRPARLVREKNAYPARVKGKHGGRRIRAYRLCREFGIEIFETVRFHRCQIDNNGILILDLKDTRPAQRKRR